jgi:hypothetical protein
MMSPTTTTTAAAPTIRGSQEFPLLPTFAMTCGEDGDVTSVIGEVNTGVVDDSEDDTPVVFLVSPPAVAVVDNDVTVADRVVSSIDSPSIEMGRRKASNP